MLLHKLHLALCWNTYKNDIRDARINFIHNAVCLVLPYPTETATEILLAQQLHTAADGIHRLHYLIIEYYQIDKDKPDEPLQYVQIQRRLSTQQIYQHSTQTEQKKDEYEEKEFYAHGT